MYFTKRTDMAIELSEKCSEKEAVHKKYELYGSMITDTVVSEEGAKAIGKPKGRYFTLDMHEVPDVRREIYALSAVLRKILPPGKCLAVGLGNPEISADSLGWNTAQRILATSQYIDGGLVMEGLGNISVIRTNVSSNSGIDSTVQAKAAAKAINAAYILAIDSLSCAHSGRLCSNIQVTDSGISPGSGAGNPRSRLDRESVGVPVIAIGVPTALEYKDADSCYYVTRRDIDLDVRRYAHVISAAVNRTISPGLSTDDFHMLMNYS